MGATEPQLIARAAFEHDHAAFGDLVRLHQSGVRQFLRHLTRGDHALADDLAQETFIQAYRSLHRFQGNARFSTWLFGIAHNYWRNARRRQKPTIALHETEHAVDDVTSPHDTADLRQDLDSALQALSADEQMAVHLAFRQGLTHSEIATLLTWPLGTVKTHLARGKEKLRHLLAAWDLPS